MLDVVGAGTNSVDEVLLLAADTSSLAGSGKARIAERHVFFGGQTATVTAACSALGLRSGYVGAFGSDDNGKRMRAALSRRDIDFSYAIECDAPNRSAIILVDARGRRTVLWQRSEWLALTPEDIDPRSLDARIVHVDDDDTALALHVARTARDAGREVTSDIEHRSDSVEQLISTVTHPILGQHLAAQLAGEEDSERCLRRLRRLNPGVLCMTLGEEGAVALEDDRFHVAPAFRVQVVDDTGAGDVFRAGVIYGLLQKWMVPEILRFANAAAAVSCTRLGAMPSVPSLAEVQHLLASTDNKNR